MSNTFQSWDELFIDLETNRNPKYIINLFSDLAGTTLPEAIKLKLESLENIDLVLSTSEIYLKFADDLRLNLDDIFDTSSTVPYMDMALDKIIAGTFGSSEFILSAPKLGIFKNIQEIELRLQGLFNSQNIKLVFSKQTTLKYQLPNDINFSSLTNQIPILNELNLINPELIITNITYCYAHSKLGQINLSRGFNFIGDINFSNIKTNFGNFIHNQLKIDCLGTLISFNPIGQVNLTGNIPSSIQLFSVQKFSATFSNLLIKLNIESDLEPNFGLTGNLILQGYDPTQKDEHPLCLSGNLTLEPESLTAFFCQQDENSWSNPYGLVGTEFRNIGFQGGGTYLPPYFDNFGFIGDLKWEQIYLNVAFLIDTNDPEKLALLLNTNQVVGLVDLWRGPINSFVLKQATQTDLVNKALGFLDKFVDLNIESINTDGGGEGKKPLIKYAPFPTTIAGKPIPEGLEINGIITAWGHKAIFILQGDKTFRNIEGSLKVTEINLGFVKIGGMDDNSLDLALKVTDTEQYFIGDGCVEIFNNKIANVEFKITPTNAIFKNFDLNFANFLSIDVDALSVDMKSGSGSGIGTVSVLGNTLAGITFDITNNSLLLKNSKLSLAGFLTVSIPILTVNLINQSAMGIADISAFNQSLGSGTLSFNTSETAINNAVINLVNIVKLSVPNFNLDLTNKKIYGIGDVTLLGKKFTSLGISINNSGFQAASNFNFGILAFNGATVTLSTANGNINNSASIAGNLKFLGYTFANIIASVNSSKLTAFGSFNFGGIFILKGVNKNKNATITIKKAKNGLYNRASIAGSFYILGQELTSIAANSNSHILKVLGIKVSGNTSQVKKTSVK
ncbi:Na-Ca exchanger/integrin-beta4 [Calothrix sp. NIES-4071]|nr:Na-Ca exchanger/integrin-beta4 [Calothrix sp. NIES-4071]BAZ55690.1 Na-Ca exchanger/integrin-beta4 [Calothrix sp. NIES-4105]